MSVDSQRPRAHRKLCSNGEFASCTTKSDQEVWEARPESFTETTFRLCTGGATIRRDQRESEFLKMKRRLSDSSIANTYEGTKRERACFIGPSAVRT